MLLGRSWALHAAGQCTLLGIARCLAEHEESSKQAEAFFGCRWGVHPLRRLALGSS